MDRKPGQGLIKERGVVLRRKDSAEGDRSIYVLLEKEGPQWLLAPGAARGRVRFGGSTDPLVWGTFHIYRGPNRWYLRDVDVRRDFWPIRRSSTKILMAAEWASSLVKYTLPGHPCDELLPVFFWSLCLLEGTGAREDLAEWRFYWKWLRSWGIAPDLESCQSCGTLLEEALFCGEYLLCRECSGSRKGVDLDRQDLRELRASCGMCHEDFLENAGCFNISREKTAFGTRALERILAERT